MPDEHAEMEVQSVDLGTQASHNRDAVIVALTSQSQEVPVSAQQEEQGGGSKEMAPRSEIWQHFIKIKEDKGNVKTARCKYCHQNMKAEAGRHGLFKEYRKLYSSSEETTDVSDSIASKGGRGGKLKEVIAKRMKLGIGSNSNNKSELDKYLSEETEDTEIKLDLLVWWKASEQRFPILSRLARDVLAIPISIVASESAFSTSGRILDDFRSSLTPFMLEALVCTQDWLRWSKPIDITENIEELTMLEQEFGKGKQAASSKTNATTGIGSNAIDLGTSTS